MDRLSDNYSINNDRMTTLTHICRIGGPADNAAKAITATWPTHNRSYTGGARRTAGKKTC